MLPPNSRWFEPVAGNRAPQLAWQNMRRANKAWLLVAPTAAARPGGFPAQPDRLVKNLGHPPSRPAHALHLAAEGAAVDLARIRNAHRGNGFAGDGETRTATSAAAAQRQRHTPPISADTPEAIESAFGHPAPPDVANLRRVVLDECMLAQFQTRRSFGAGLAKVATWRRAPARRSLAR